MDPIKGVHALATSFFAMLIAYLGYSFVEKFITSVPAGEFRYVLWSSYILAILVATLAIPALIAMGQDNDASIISMVVGLGVYFAMLIFNRIFWPIMQMFVGDGDTITGILINDSFSLQLMTLLWVTGIIISLYVLPTIVGTMPNYVWEKTKNTVEDIVTER